MKNLIKRVDIVLESTENISIKLQKICQLLHDEVDYYHWVGFYFNNADKKELKLDAYVGKLTDHNIIPFGKGICGQVAESNQLFMVPDVLAQDNYLACSLETKSEIVVPIMKNGKNIGQIDIDSHQIDPFTPEDVELLEYICNKIAIQY